MKLLLNDKEIANFLSSFIDITKELKEISVYEEETAIAIAYVAELRNKPMKGGFKKNLRKYIPKIKSKITRGVEKDLRAWVETIKDQIERKRKSNFNTIHKNINRIISTVGEEAILKAYKKSNITGFIKGTGEQLTNSGILTRRGNFSSIEEDCLLRNTVGNENLLVSKIDNSKPFWFIDSGYTNFLESNKKWHRLVHNHLHYGNTFEAPVDRLGIFKEFPKQWRQDGEKILIIEPGQFAAAIFHIDIKLWKYEVVKELRKYTDKRIFFRPKVAKKKRPSLHQHLLDEDYYCVININSNAATEAVWAGIPIITLDKHITNPISRNKLSDINNLLRPNLSSWLCELSYSQFTYDELINGTAVNIIRKYHV